MTRLGATAEHRRREKNRAEMMSEDLAIKKVCKRPASPLGSDPEDGLVSTDIDMDGPKDPPSG